VRRKYLIAAKPSTERPLYSFPLPTTSSLAGVKSQAKLDPPIELTDAAWLGYHSVSLSPFGAARRWLLRLWVT
jgi:hypothetical protein